MPNAKPKVAIVHDWLVTYAGADRVVDCMHHVFPDAPIYTLVYDKERMPRLVPDLRYPHHLHPEAAPSPPEFTGRCCPGCPPPSRRWICPSMIWCSPPAPPAVRGSSPGRTRCTSATATPPPATCGISTIPTATTPTGWFAGVMPHQIHKLRVWDKCARRPGGLLHRQLPLHRPAHQEVLPPGCGCDLPLRPYQRGTPGPQGGLLPGGGPLYLVQAHGSGGGGLHQAGQTPGGHRHRRGGVQTQGHGRPHHPVSGRRPLGRGGPGLLPAGKGLPSSPGRRTSASPRWRPRAPAPRCWPSAGAAPCESVVDGQTGLFFHEQTVDSVADCILRFEAEGVACSAEQIPRPQPQLLGGAV